METMKDRSTVPESSMPNVSAVTAFSQPFSPQKESVPQQQVQGLTGQQFSALSGPATALQQQYAANASTFSGQLPTPEITPLQRQLTTSEVTSNGALPLFNPASSTEAPQQAAAAITLFAPIVLNAQDMPSAVKQVRQIEKGFRCPTCAKQCTSRQVLESHYASAHQGTRWLCNHKACQSAERVDFFKDPSNCRRHFNRAHGAGLVLRYHCSHAGCSYSSTRLDNLVRHKKKLRHGGAVSGSDIH